MYLSSRCSRYGTLCRIGNENPVFSETLQQVAAAGVQLLAVDCHVQPDRMELDAFVPICFGGKEESV